MTLVSPRAAYMLSLNVTAYKGYLLLILTVLHHKLIPLFTVLHFLPVCFWNYSLKRQEWQLKDHVRLLLQTILYFSVTSKVVDYDLLEAVPFITSMSFLSLFLFCEVILVASFSSLLSDRWYSSRFSLGLIFFFH